MNGPEVIHYREPLSYLCRRAVEVRTSRWKDMALGSSVADAPGCLVCEKCTSA